MAVENILPKYGGYECDFVDEVPERFICSICSRVLRDPHLTEVCGQHFCETCLQHWFGTQGKEVCPHCQSEGEKFFHITNRALKREIDDLKIYCSNRRLGCKWKGGLSSLKTHLDSEKGCGHVEVDCTNKCKEHLKRKDLADHLTQRCPLRRYKCQYCGEQDTYQTIIEKHYGQCPSYPLDCPNECGTRGIKWVEMGQHRSKCPQEPVECPFREAGCQTKLVRETFDSHMTTNQQQHLLRVLGAFREAKAELCVVKADLAAAKKELSATKDDLSETRTDLEAMKTAQKVIATDVVIMHQNDQKELSDLALASIKSQLDVKSFRLEDYGQSLIFRMTNFSHYQQSGKVWYSPPFYYGAGYKMQLAVYANGTGAGTGTYMSIALLLLKGEFDHQIEWPIQAYRTISIEIIPQKSIETLGKMKSTGVLPPEPTPAISFASCPRCKPVTEGVRELTSEKCCDHKTVNDAVLLNDSLLLRTAVKEYYCLCDL